MTISREDLAAYADGELAGKDRDRIEAAIAVDPDLARWLEEERALRVRLASHFAPVADEPIPDNWLRMIAEASAPATSAARDAVEDSANVVSLDAFRAKAVSRWHLPAWGTGLAMAASLAFGLVIGNQASDQDPVAVRGNMLVADADLAHALDGQLSDSTGTAHWRMLASFKRIGGGYCRVFSAAEAGGVACHRNGDWRIEHLLPGSSPQSTAYRQAGSGSSDLMALAQIIAADAPLDAAGEKAAQSNGWE